MVAIIKWIEARAHHRSLDALDAIFFEASGTKTFATAEVRAAFRERWLGRYLRQYPEWVYLALNDEDRIAGYLLGCLDDPAKTPMFSDIGYFQNFAHLTARFPAQIHVNLAPLARGHGTGGRLVSAFSDDARRAGCPGVHVVTARGLRNTKFYALNGFNEAGHIDWQGRELLFLARDLAPLD